MIKKILLFTGVILGFFALFLFLFVYSNKPDYSGNLNLKGLVKEVTVYFDEAGVPHIYAQNEADAYLALGYLHAQDRLWQMELVRRVGAGRLSEIFGESMVETDQFFRGIGIAAASEASVSKLDTTSKSYLLANAYLNGINQFIEEGATPLEFRLLGLKKEYYTIKDIFNVYGYMAFSFAQAHKTDPFLTAIGEKLGSAYLEDLDIHLNPGATLIQNYHRNLGTEVASNLSGAVNDIMETLPVPPFIGSNSWVIGAKRTKNGKVILANDPHIGYSQPAVWYQSHIVTPEYEMYGFNLALTPFPLLGHNRKYAYGLTMFENDDIDFYQEDSLQQFDIRKEVIKVKDSDNIIFEVKTGTRGPVMNGLLNNLDSTKNISMDWVYTRFSGDMIGVTYKISHAKSLREFRDGVSEIYAPGLNVMYGDADNNIAWFAAAKLYRHAEGVNTNLILDNRNGNKHVIEYFDFEQNPQAVNPPWNYVYSANNQPGKVGDYLYPGYYVAEDRAKRIVQLLEAKKDFTREDAKNMINDVQSAVAPGLIRIISQNLTKVSFTENENKALEILTKWDGAYAKNSVAPVIYNKFLYLFLKMTFQDEMGVEGFDQFMETHLSERQIAKQIKNKNSIWWDDVSTKHIKENNDEIFTNAFHLTISQLEEQFGKELSDWTWNKALSVTHKHAFDKVSYLKWIFNVGPFQLDGGNEVINNQIFDINEEGVYQITAGPSTRRIIDFSDIENGLTILPTGQSGNVFSKHYSNQSEKFIRGEFVKMMLNKEEIERSEDKLILTPGKK